MKGINIDNGKNYCVFETTKISEKEAAMVRVNSERLKRMARKKKEGYKMRKERETNMEKDIKMDQLLMMCFPGKRSFHVNKTFASRKLPTFCQN